MKKNLFSQILSICLALCMATALLPAVALTADAADAGYTIVYDFIDNYAKEKNISKASLIVKSIKYIADNDIDLK